MVMEGRDFKDFFLKDFFGEDLNDYGEGFDDEDKADEWKHDYLVVQ